jgi:hypothetical protein
MFDQRLRSSSSEGRWSAYPRELGMLANSNWFINKNNDLTNDGM